MNRHIPKVLGFGLIAILGLSILAACAGIAPSRGDPNSGVTLRYNMPVNKPLIYQLSNSFEQNLDVMGQMRNTDFNSSYEFQVKSNGLKRNRHLLTVTVNSIKMRVNSPQGEFTPDVSAIPGKSFAMALTPLGKELDLSEAKSLTYSMSPGDTRSVASDIQGFFPDLSDRPVKMGDSWTTWDTVRTDESSMKLRMIFQNHHTMQGVETVNGHECVKIVTNVTGVMDGGGEQNGTPLEFNGNIQSADTWYFAYKEGLFVKSTSEGTTDASIDAGGMNIPMTMKMKTETSLLE